MLFILKATTDGEHIHLNVQPDWTRACWYGRPEAERFLSYQGCPEEYKTAISDSQESLAEDQGTLIILDGLANVQQFVDAMATAADPWCEYAAAFSYCCERAGLTASAHLIMPNFYDTKFGQNVIVVQKQTHN